jgi:ubiquinone/menaquinone biosynthesis C-methylase UbiE
MVCMDLKELEKAWNGYALRDPLWAILTARGKQGGKWDDREFFASGEAEIESVMRIAKSLFPSLQRRKALDFGCGVGRLTLPLARHFQEVTGIDISRSMVELAKRHNQYGERCRYYVNMAEDLALFDDCEFDLVYSSLVLQHMAPRYALGYIREFIRLLQPNGLLVFQMAGRPRTLLKRATFFLFSERTVRFLRMVKYRTAHPIQMYGIRPDQMVPFLEAMDAKILDIIDETPPKGGWESCRYFVSKS